MKKILLLVAIASLFACGKEDVKKDFYHCTYVTAGALQSLDVVKASNWGQFDYIYMVASPKWVAEDFDDHQDFIEMKYIASQSYPDGDSGRALVPAAIEEAKKQGSKVLLSFAEGDYKTVAVDPQRRDKYAKMMVDFAVKNKYDGVELDWEHTVTIPLHNLFLKDLRKHLDVAEKEVGHKLYLTSALNSGHSYTKEQADSASQYADWLNVMCYDMGGGIWGKTPTHNTPFTDIKKAMAQWDVFDPKKISFGMASYGYYYENIKPGETITDTTKNLKDFGRYGNAVELQQYLSEGWTTQFDSTQGVNYFYSPDSTKFMTMETPATAIEKAKWAIDKGYQGLFWWVWSTDFVPAKEGEKFGKHIIMDPVDEAIVGYKI